MPARPPSPARPDSPDQSSRRVAVVTGASSGIGAATASRLAGAGWHVLLGARRLGPLRELAGLIGGTAVSLDVTEPADAERLADTARALGNVDLLVNNAGVAYGVDRVDSMPLQRLSAMLDVNVVGTLRVTQALLPLLRQAPHAQIITITSTAAFTAYEGGGGYAAAKHALGALVRTLRLELNGEPIRICEIAPGMVATEEFSANRFGGDAALAAKVYEGVDQPLTADDVARCVEWVATAPAHLNVDTMVLRPVAQAAQHKTFRGPIFDRS